MPNDLLERWDEVDPIVKKALEIPHDRRHLYVERQCVGNKKLLDLVARILGGDAEYKIDRINELRGRLIDEAYARRSGELED